MSHLATKVIAVEALFLSWWLLIKVMMKCHEPLEWGSATIAAESRKLEPWVKHDHEQSSLSALLCIIRSVSEYAYHVKAH